MFAAMPASICKIDDASTRERQRDEGKGGLTQASAANATAARLFHWLMMSNLTPFDCQRAFERGGQGVSDSRRPVGGIVGEAVDRDRCGRSEDAADGDEEGLPGKN